MIYKNSLAGYRILFEKFLSNHGVLRLCILQKYAKFFQ